LGERLAILLEPGLLRGIAAAAATARRDGERQRLAGIADGELDAAVAPIDRPTRCALAMPSATITAAASSAARACE
jgi:hypothetical protein